MVEEKKKAVVVIALSGSRWEDARRATMAVRQKFGDPRWTKPRGWIWHHTGEGGKVQLVPAELHANLSHTGGFVLNPVANTIGQPRQLGASPFPLTESYAPLQPATLGRFEELLEVRLPADYRNFLLRNNGGRPRVNGFRIENNGQASDEVLDYFLGIAQGEQDDIVTFLQGYADRLPPELLPSAYDAFGNLICLGLSEPFAGQVLFWNHELEPESDDTEYSNLTVVAPNFSLFVKSFFEDDVQDRE